ncbi:MAG: DUF853 family protein [Flavobacteriales bacterium]|nr:DUF853 family protein [Flavobacteriales bacterium]
MSTSTEEFKSYLEKGYTFKKSDSIIIGCAMLDEEPVQGAQVKIPLKSMNRHGLIAGATGTGKTKTLQILAEQLSQNGVPCLLMDLKGDLSGLARPGELNDHITWRHDMIQTPYEATGFPIEFLTLSDEPGARLRATVTEFGPVLLSKILELNSTQSGIMALVFKYCDDNKLPLLDLKDLKRTLQFLINEGKEEIEGEYGRVSSASVSTIMRKIIELEQQGAEAFFGERSFDVNDLVRHDEDGNGILSVIRLTDIQDRPKLFSTFMLSLLAEVYSQFPEEGDMDKPKLCIFIDEAHLIFDNASDALLDQIEAIVKLIRSKAVGVYFVTQNPTDVPDAVLSQLGLKVQHALRAFTAKDRRNIKRTAENYPLSDYYKTDEVLTSLGIGQALITALNEKGIPTPLAATLLRAPQSRMDILTKKEIKAVVADSDIITKYNEVIDSKSAYEILQEKLEKASSEEVQKENAKTRKKAAKEVKGAKEASMFETMSKNTMMRQLGRTVVRELTRGLLGALGVKRR